MKTIEAPKRISLKSILMATDFSPISQTALQFAKSITRRYGAKMFVAHVMTPSEAPILPPESWGTCQQILDDTARQELTKIAEGLQGLPHEATLCYGGIWDALSKLIAKHDVDLLVMGTHGREGFGRLLMGSAAEEVFRRASCPVLTIGPKVSAAAEPDADFKEIVLATDFSPASMLATSYAVSLAEDYQSRLTLLYVVKQPVEGLADMDRIVRDRMTELHDLVPASAEFWCRTKCVVQFGDPAEQIIALAQERKANLIVLGVRPASPSLGAATHIAAATAHSVLVSAPCPVLSIRG